MDSKKINKSLVKAYNDLAVTYDKNRDVFDMTEVLNNFYDSLKIKKGKLLDSGCGAGVPFASWFIQRGWYVTGVDLSENMLELAKELVPKMKQIYSPIQEVNFKNNSFDAITAIYSLFHLSCEDQSNMFKKFYRWLKSNGSIVFTYATKEFTGHNTFSGYIEFMGEKLFYSHRTPDQLKNELTNIGFIIDSFTYRDIGKETFLWVTLSKA